MFVSTHLHLRHPHNFVSDVESDTVQSSLSLPTLCSQRQTNLGCPPPPPQTDAQLNMTKSMNMEKDKTRQRNP